MSVPPTPAVDPFAPPTDAWQPLSPRYVPVKRLVETVGTLLVFVPLAIAAWFLLSDQRWVFWAVVAVGVCWLAWRLIRAGRWVRSWGWAIRDHDLCFRHGLWTRSLTMVPLGRLQMVKVSAGPFLRMFGLAKVELVTASPLSDAEIPGLPAAEASSLRDRLIELSDATGAGL